jgi:microcystin-dependent protein
MAFARSTAPPGWLECDGAEVAIATYSTLASAIYVGDADNATASIVYGFKTNGSGTRSTSGSHIKLPDLRGEFLRGWDDGRGVDSSRGFATAQSATRIQNGPIATNLTPLDLPYSEAEDVTTGGNRYVVPNNSPTGSATGSSFFRVRPRNVSVVYCIKT